MAAENYLWGAERIRGELLKLGIEVIKRTIQKSMPKERKARSAGPPWATFLKNQADARWACDFTVAYDWLFQTGYIFVVMELKTRWIGDTGVTKYPTDAWTAQQRREATPWGRGPKYLIRDRDKKYATRFSAVALGLGIKEVKTPYRTPQANGICERFMGSGLSDVIVVTVPLRTDVTVVVAVDELLAGMESVVALLIVVVLLSIVPSATPELTFTVNVKSSAAPTARLAMVQVTVPVPPTAGVAQVHPSGEESETNVVPVGTVSVKLTVSAVSGPLFT